MTKKITFISYVIFISLMTFPVLHRMWHNEGGVAPGTAGYAMGCLGLTYSS